MKVGVGIACGGGLGGRVAVGGNRRRKNGTRVGFGVAVSVIWIVGVSVWLVDGVIISPVNALLADGVIDGVTITID